MSEIYEPLERTHRRKNVDEMVVACIERSITYASLGRLVVHPASAARYATNALLFHEPKLLAASAVAFARKEVEAILAGEVTDE